MQLPLEALLPKTKWRPPSLDALPSWRDAKRIGFDVETRDEDLFELGCGARRPNCYVVGYSFALDEGPAHYLPIRHAGGGNMPVEPVLEYLRDQARDFGGEVVGADLPYDLDYAEEDGIRWTNSNVSFWDVLTTDSLIWEHHRSYRLEEVAARRGFDGKDEELIKEAARYYGDSTKGSLWKMNGHMVGTYGERDARLPLMIRDQQLGELRAQSLERADRLESDIIPITVAMRRKGVKIDLDRLERVERWAIGAQDARLAQFAHLSGIRVTMDDCRSPFAMQAIVARLGLPDLPKTPTGKPQLQAATLDAYHHPAMTMIREARKIDKLRTTYIPSIHKYMVRGRVHATLKSARATREGSEGGDGKDATGTISRRFSCVHPNLQNQPNPEKDANPLTKELGTLWRSIYVRDDGALGWALADFSQQEPRWIVHYAEALHLPKAKEMGDAFRNDPETNNHKMIAKITGLPYNLAKIIFLARCYGAGLKKIALQLKAFGAWEGQATEWRVRRPGDWIPPGGYVGESYETAVPEIESIVKQFDEYAPYVKALARKCTEVGEARGYVLLPDGGRARAVPDGEHNYLDSHAFLNKLAQGSGAIQGKMALRDLHRAGLTPQLAVHDDMQRSYFDEREPRLMRDICRDALKGSVPFLVKIKTGHSYGEADAAEALSLN